MKLSDLLKNIDNTIYGGEDVLVSGLCHNSKEVRPGDVFFAIRGESINGEEYCLEAKKNGASAIVSENKIIVEGLINVVVPDVRKAMSLMAAEYYHNPSEKMFIIGVTGTNGKTTTTYMLKSIFEKAGKKVGVIGTNGIMIDKKKYGSNFTTPDPILLQEALNKMVTNGINVVCMEISAHALELQKTRGIMCDIALFTNLTQDHLDFFKTMDNYFAAKSKLFNRELARFGVVNVDDEYGKIIYNNAEIPLLTISREKNDKNCRADILARNEKHNNINQEFDVCFMKSEFHIKINLLGGFNVSNALGAIAASIMAGVNVKTISSALEELEGVDGRFNSTTINGVKIIVDYAHTPDGLKNVLNVAREITDRRLISVFGCGGNRDKTKRQKMGEISSRLADITFITSDNPRMENPQDIIEDIKMGVSKQNFIVEVDRIQAIIKAVDYALPGDTIVISGKGNEDYFDVNNEKVKYVGDINIVEEIKRGMLGRSDT